MGNMGVSSHMEHGIKVAVTEKIIQKHWGKLRDGEKERRASQARLVSGYQPETQLYPWQDSSDSLEYF